MRDVTLGETHYFKFPTRALTGIPTTLAGTPIVAAYEDNNLTQITGGVSLIVDHDSVVGSHLITVVVTSGNGFEAGKYYNLTLTAGTVGGVSIAGESAGEFTIQSSASAVDLANATDGLTASKVILDSRMAEASINTTTGAIDLVTNVFNNVGITQVGADKVWLSTARQLTSNGLDLILATSVGFVEIAKAIWDRVLTGATHNINNSAGRKLRQVGVMVLTSGTAQAGSVNTITLASSESTTDNIYRGDRVVITGGTGQEEHGIVIDYVGATRDATMSKNWTIIPDNTSEYELSVATVDVESWGHVPTTVSTTTQKPEMDATSISDSATAADNLEANISNLDAAVSNANTVTPPTVEAIRTEMDSNSTQFATIISRIGAFTGSGINNILGFLRSLLRSDIATDPSDIGGTFDSTTDSTQALRDNQGGGGGGGTDWSAGERENIRSALGVDGTKTTASSGQLQAIPTTPMRGTDGANTVVPLAAASTATQAKQDAAQSDLDAITGADGTTLATLQPNYAPNTQTPLNAAEVNAEVDNALNTAIPGSPVAGSLNERVAAVDDAVSEARLSELDAGTAGKMANQVDEVRSDTGEIGTAGGGLTALGGMSAAMQAEILSEVNAALDEAVPELAQGQPSATPSMRTGMMLGYMVLRNRLDTNTSGTDELAGYNDAGTKIVRKLLSDAGGDYSEAKMISGA